MAISTSILLKFSGSAVQRGLASIRSSFSRLNKAGGQMLGSMISKTAKWGSLLAAVGISKIGVDAIKAASDMETLMAQFTALLQSGDKATAFIEKLRKLNIESPLGLDDFAKGGKALLGVEFTADQAADALDKLSNISMGNAENFESLVRAFSQVKSAGRLMGQEVLQFVNASFNPLTQISKQTGESMATLKKRMEDGKISFQEVANAINYATASGGLFNGMNAKIAATTEGKFNKMKDSVTQLMIAFGTPVNDHLRPMIDSLSARAAGLVEQAKQLGSITGKFGTSLTMAFDNGDLWNLIKAGFLAATSAIGEKLIAAFIYGGTIISNAVKDGLRGVDLGVLGKIKVGDSVPMSWAAASETARNALGSEGFANGFNAVVDRNQAKLPQGFEYAPKGVKTQFNDGNGSFLVKMAASLQSIDQKLSPQ